MPPVMNFYTSMASNHMAIANKYISVMGLFTRQNSIFLHSQ